MHEKILLISRPFGAMECPVLGLSQLNARLVCDVRYPSFIFTDMLGEEECQI